MKHNLLHALLGMVLITLSAVAQQDRITSAISNESRIALPNSVHPLVLAAAMSKPVDPDLPLAHIVLMLKADSARQAALEQLLAAQQDATSAEYHKFITSKQFAAAYGVSPNDIAKVCSWLASNGLHVDEVAGNNRAIIFSGTAAQVAATFKTEIREYVVAGQTHYANATAPQIPAALGNVVHSLLKLNDFHSKPGIKSLYTSSSSQHYLSPADYAVIYNANPLFAAGINGTSQSIAVVGRSNVNPFDIANFRTNYGLPAANITTVYATGTDPGITDAGDAAEATLDLEWAGAMAPNAALKFVIAANSTSTDGVDLAAQYAVIHNVAPILSVSFGTCEAVANNAFYSNLWQQAAAEGISVFVAAGDSGAAGCDSASAGTGTLQGVNAICSSPYTTCVGGTLFDDTANPDQYWLTGNNQSLGSATGYIPETVWNESALEAGGYGLFATGGGASGIYVKPFWQTGPGVPADGRRDVPDISLSAAQHDGYLIFYNGGMATVFGTSAATPAFAGIMALVTQKNGGAQGNINQTLYPLAAKATAAGASPIFHDITSGNNSVPGVTGSSAAAGYDLASGLGSVDATQLTNLWTSATNGFAFSASAASITATPGQNGVITLTIADSGSFTGAVSLNANSLPAGVVASFAPATITGSGSSVLSLTVAGWATSGTYPVTIKATATSTGISRTVNFNVVLVVPANCTLSALPTALTVLQSQAASVKLSCGSLQGVFSGSLSMTVSGAPAGVTPAFSPSTSLVAGTGTVTLIANASSAAVPGTYALLVTATLPGANPAFVRTLSVPLTVNAPAYFSVTPSASSISLPQGGTGAVTLTSLHNGAFNSAVNFSVSGQPSGVTALLSATQVQAPGDGTITMSLQSTSITTPGNYRMLVVASGAGLSVTIPITLSITTAPAFTLTASGAVLLLHQSSTAAITLNTGTLTGGFNLPVTLTVSGLPSGVTAVFAPAGIAAPGAGSSVMTLTAAAGVTAGVYTITVAAAGGTITRYVNIRLTVAPAASFSLSVSLPSYNILAGSALTETVTSTALYGFNTTINLSTAALPAGLTASFVNTTINGAYGTTTMQIQTNVTLAPGIYPITVMGTDALTNNVQSTVVNLTVGNLQISLSASSVNVPRGSPVSTVITIVANSYSGNVFLSLTNVPVGVTYVFSKSTLVGSGSSTLTLSTNSSASLSTSTINVRAGASAFLVTTPLTLLID